MLDELRLLFLSSNETRRLIDTATYITNNTLKAIEGKLSALSDDVSENMGALKICTASPAIVKEVYQDVRELKNETHLLGKHILTLDRENFQVSC